jgi:hypothetical protein
VTGCKRRTAPVPDEIDAPLPETGMSSVAAADPEATDTPLAAAGMTRLAAAVPVATADPVALVAATSAPAPVPDATDTPVAATPCTEMIAAVPDANDAPADSTPMVRVADAVPTLADAPLAMTGSARTTEADPDTTAEPDAEMAAAWPSVALPELTATPVVVAGTDSAADAVPLAVDTPAAVTDCVTAPAPLNVAMLPIHGDDVLSVEEKLNVPAVVTASYPWRSASCVPLPKAVLATVSSVYPPGNPLSVGTVPVYVNPYTPVTHSEPCAVVAVVPVLGVVVDPVLLATTSSGEPARMPETSWNRTTSATPAEKFTVTVVVPARQFVAAQIPQDIVPDVMSTTFVHVCPALSKTADTLCPEVSELKTTLMSSRFPAVLDVTEILPVVVSLFTVLTRTTSCTEAGATAVPAEIVAVPLATDAPVAPIPLTTLATAVPVATAAPAAPTGCVRTDPAVPLADEVPTAAAGMDRLTPAVPVATDAPAESTAQTTTPVGTGLIHPRDALVLTGSWSGGRRRSGIRWA